LWRDKTAQEIEAEKKKKKPENHVNSKIYSWALGVAGTPQWPWGGFGHPKQAGLGWLRPMMVVRSPLSFLKIFLIFYYFSFYLFFKY
jgi:hypothetical protein